MGSSFAEKIKSGSSCHIYLVKGCDFTGRRCWYFVKILASRSTKFDAMLARHELTNLEKAADILLCGYGDMPPASAYHEALEKLS
jgi:hypothetical protein